MHTVVIGIIADTEVGPDRPEVAFLELLCPAIDIPVQ
jgi:hypothetical protein